MAGGRRRADRDGRLPLAPAERLPLLCREWGTARHRLGSSLERADRRGRCDRGRGCLRGLAPRPRERRLVQLVEGLDDDGRPQPSARSRPPRPALRSVSAKAKRPIYWVGPRSGQTYELTRTASGASSSATCPRAPRSATGAPTTRSSAHTRRRTRSRSCRISRSSPTRRACPRPAAGSRSTARRADERLRRLSRLRRADRGLRPVCEAGAAPRDVGPRRARRVAGWPCSSPGSSSRSSSRGSRSAADGWSSSPRASGCRGRSCSRSGSRSSSSPASSRR